MPAEKFPARSHFPGLVPMVLFVLLLLSGFQSRAQDTPLRVKWSLERNFTGAGGEVHTCTFTLTNTSASVLRDDWALYWNQAPRRIIRTAPEKKLVIRNINGDFYELKPQSGFRLKPGQSVTLEVLAAGWMIKEADAPVGLYQVFYKKGDPVIKPVEEYFLAPFERPEQLTRSPDDEEPIPAADYLFAANEQVSLLPAEDMYPWLPGPVSVRPGGGRFAFGPEIGVAAVPGLEKEASILIQGLAALHGLSAIRQAVAPAIRLSLDEDLPKDEAYRLLVDDDGIAIAGKDAAGVFYGLQSLLLTIRKEDVVSFVPKMEVLDYPAYPYRGFHLDVGRNFQSKETIFRVLDLLALLKVNKFLLYLTEDEGWRLEIEELPELTQVAARRGHTLDDSEFLQPAYGSGPFPDDPASNGNGFYSRQDFKEILRYAHDRHIEVIPSLNLPGHARAAIKAMENRYHRLMKEGREREALEYRLIDPDDASVYRSAQYYTDNTACVCREQAYRFYETVLDDIIEMYREAGIPLSMIHAGGDEVPGTAWKGSPICREYLRNYPDIKDTRNLQAHFFDRLTRLVAAKGLAIGGWEEVVMEYDDQKNWVVNPDFAGRRVYPYIWNNLWGQQDLGYRIANQGYPVILCPVTNFYFDLAYNKDPREPGLYWAGFNDTRDAFNCVPGNLFLSTTEDDMGRAYDPAVDFKDMERLTAAGRNNIIGIQGQLWSETVRGREMLEYYILPKIIGFAQRAWQGDPAWSREADPDRRGRRQEDDWNRFANTVGRRIFPLLDVLNGGYNYRLPAPGIAFRNGELHMNTAYPGLEIRYTTDGTEPLTTSPLYRQPFRADGQTIIAKCFNRQGRSGFSSTLKK